MEIRRFFVNPDSIGENLVTVSGDEFLHLSKVLRLKVGFRIVVADGSSTDRFCTIEQINSDHAVARIDSCEPNTSETACGLTLFAGVLKNNNLDYVVQKAVESGAKRIVPFTSEFCSADTVKADRLRRIALESAKQCGRSILPEVTETVDFCDIFQTEESRAFDTKVMYYENEKILSADAVRYCGNIAVIVGSEGGFSEGEVGLARANGWLIASLGKRIFRADTASVVALTVANLMSGEMKP